MKLFTVQVTEYNEYESTTTIYLIFAESLEAAKNQFFSEEKENKNNDYYWEEYDSNYSGLQYVYSHMEY